ncbi:hypothetical protein GIB67_020452 [Kingdonia uniflora]|uniref:Transcription factor CBF/NF-Y/archaeal histone domain-containing protein n=1 Tax=Kingdonia uniflora TaxID=39325 RepID=A0A7J7LUX6_9MAGN|nr:hypothetical protein GIB67_020452 [Kingdonia uniflora]
MAEEEKETPETLKPQFPLGRVKKMMKLDKEINIVNSEALYLVTLSIDLFLQFLAEKSSEVAVEKKRKIVKIEHLRIATKRHQPTNDFLMDSLPMPSSKDASTSQNQSEPLPAGTRRIDHFFSKSTNEAE